MLFTIGMDSQIKKAALPYPNTLSSIMEYYGLKRMVIRFLTSRASMIPASPTRLGLVFPTSKSLLAESKFSTRDAILNFSYLINMSDNNTENHGSDTDVMELPLLARSERGKLLTPLVPDWTNVAKRLSKDMIVYSGSLEKRYETRSVLHIEASEALNIKNVLEEAGKIVYRSKSGFLPSNEDLKNLATYLDWSYQEQVGIPANTSNKEEAEQHGIGALDTWALFTSIKNKLEK
jgi:hypothetical protein